MKPKKINHTAHHRYYQKSLKPLYHQDAIKMNDLKNIPRPYLYFLCSCYCTPHSTVTQSTTVPLSYSTPTTVYLQQLGHDPRFVLLDAGILEQLLHARHVRRRARLLRTHPRGPEWNKVTVGNRYLGYCWRNADGPERNTVRRGYGRKSITLRFTEGPCKDRLGGGVQYWTAVWPTVCRQYRIKDHQWISCFSNQRYLFTVGNLRSICSVLFDNKIILYRYIATKRVVLTYILLANISVSE